MLKLTTKSLLRPVTPADLPILFEYQADREAVAMSAYPAKDWGEFARHWEGIFNDKNVVARAIMHKGKLAGHVLCWREGYEQRVGYWLGKDFWRRGLASKAVAELLGLVKTRPLYAQVANHNIASRRVLEKNGFELLEEGSAISIWRLDATEQI